MNQLIVGSNLTDLGRNSLAANQQDQDASQATANRLLAIAQEMNRNRNVQQELADRRQAQADQNTYLQNALAQNGQLANMQWNTPNATAAANNANQLVAAKLPWTMGITPAQQAQIDVEKNQLALANRPYDLAAQGVPIGNGPVAQAAGQLMIDKAQRAEKMDGALKAANAAYLSTVDMWHPMDAILPGDRNTKIANSVKAQLSGAIPEVNELLFSPQANGGKGGFVSQDQPQPAANPFAAASVVQPAAPTATPAASTNQLAGAALSPIAVNPSTGQKMQLVNGQWQLIQ